MYIQGPHHSFLRPAVSSHAVFTEQSHLSLPDSEGEGSGVIGGGVSASPPPGSQGFVAILEGSAAQGDMAREEEMEEDQEEGEEEEEGEEGEEGEGEGDGLSELPEVIRERLISLRQERSIVATLTK